jgi:tetratricopeptide (TPR) repeat protein
METDIQTQAFAYHLKAEVYMNLDLFAQAVKFYEKALPLYKSSSPGSLELAELYVSLGGAAFAEGSQDMLFSGNKELIRSRALESKNFIEEGLRINRALEDSEDSRIVQVMACFLMVPISGVLEQDDSQTKFLHLAEHLTMRELENDPDNPELLLLKQMIEVQKFSIATDEKFKRDLEQIVDQSKKGIDRIERMMQETINQFE